LSSSIKISSPNVIKIIPMAINKTASLFIVRCDIYTPPIHVASRLNQIISVLDARIGSTSHHLFPGRSVDERLAFAMKIWVHYNSSICCHPLPVLCIYKEVTVTTACARCIIALRQVIITILILGAGSGLASAHAVVIESSPKDKEVLIVAPREAVLLFDAKVVKSLARFSLTTSNGRIIPLPGPIKKYNGEAPDRLVIPLPTMGPGEYLLRYKVLSIDGHITIGVLHFSLINGK
jgi:copper resistance protein C